MNNLLETALNYIAQYLESLGETPEDAEQGAIDILRGRQRLYQDAFEDSQ